MKAVLEFNLPADEEDYKVASNAKEWKMVTEDLRVWLEEEMKHSEDHWKKYTQVEMLEAVNARLSDLMIIYGVEFD